MLMKNKLVELTMPFPKWCGTLKSDQKWGSYCEKTNKVTESTADRQID